MSDSKSFIIYFIMRYSPSFINALTYLMLNMLQFKMV